MASDKKQQKPTLSPLTGLTPQQEQAAMMLASGENLTAVARQLNLNRSTLYGKLTQRFNVSTTNNAKTTNKR